MAVSGKAAARTLLRCLEQSCTSPTVLYLLALPTRILKFTELGQLLIDMTAYHNVVYEFDHEFFAEVSKAAQPLRPPPGSFFRMEKSKDRAIQSFREELRRRRSADPRNRYLYAGAMMPTCFQTLRGRSDGASEHSDSLFVVHSSPEAALRHAHELLQQGECAFQQQVVPVMQVYEFRLPHPMASEHFHNRLGYVIVDWEVKESEVAGRLTRQQLESLCEEFPDWLYREMHRRRHVEHRAVVTATFKRKTRDLPGGDRKHSAHVIYNVLGVPGTHLQHILRDCLQDSARDLKKFKSKDPSVRASAFVDPETGEDEIEDHPEIGFDEAGVTGNTGVAMLFSRKREEDPYPGLAYTRAFSEGCEHVFPQRHGVPLAPNPEPFAGLSPDGQHDLARLTQDQAVYLMYMASCSVPKLGAVAPTRESCEGARVRQIRTAARLPATPEKEGGPPAGGGPASGPSVVQLLPRWFGDFVSRGRRGCENHNAALCYSEQIRRLSVPGSDPSLWHVTRYHPGAPCPKLLSDPEGPMLHYHTNNGIILAYNEALPDSVFARCTHCPDLGLTSQDVEKVRGKDGRGSNWVRFWEEGFKAALENARKKPVQKVKVEKAVKKRNRDFDDREEQLRQAKRKANAEAVKKK